MYSNFKAQGFEYLNQAKEEDKAKNYAKAFPLYMNALEYFKTHLKYEKNPNVRDSISLQFTELLQRAEQIRAILDSTIVRADDDEYHQTMNITSKEQAFELGNRALEEANLGNYPKAIALYTSVFEYLKSYVKFEQEPKVRDTIIGMIEDYERHAKLIRTFLDFDGVGLIEGTLDGSNTSNGVSGTFEDGAIEYVKKAIEEDNAGNYAKAFVFYISALEYFKVCLRYHKNYKIREAIIVKFNDYFRRAQEIRAMLDRAGPSKAQSDLGHQAS